MSTARQHNIESIENRTVPVKMGSAALIIFSTITTVASVMGTYYNLKSDIKDVATKADMQQQINNVRMGTIENNQREDHEWNRSLSHRINVLEQQYGMKINEQDSESHK